MFDRLFRTVPTLAPLLAAAVWGGMYVVSKWSFAAVPPLTMGFFRVLLGSLVLYAVVSRGTERVDREDWHGFGVLGGWVALTIATQFLGTELTNASQGSLLTVLTPVFTVVLAAAVLDETVTARKAGGMALAAAGTLVVLAGEYDLSGVVAGDGLTLGTTAGVLALVTASLAWAGYTVWGQPLVRKYSALTAATYSTLAATPMLAVLAAGELLLTDASLPVRLTPGTAFAVGYLGVGSTALAWYLWYKGLERVSAGTVAAAFFAQPVVGVALGALLLGETVGLPFLFGGGVLAVGVWVVSTARADG